MRSRVATVLVTATVGLAASAPPGPAVPEGLRPRAPPALAPAPVGLAASAALRRLAARRRPLVATPLPAAPAPVEPERDAVILPFARPAAAPIPAAPTTPARCGDSGGRTKAGAPCGARTADGSHCRHHAVAA